MILYHILPLAVNTRRRNLRSHSPLPVPCSRSLLPVPCLLFLMRPNTGHPCSFATTAGLGVRRPLVIHQYDFEPPSCPTRLALASLCSACGPGFGRPWHVTAASSADLKSIFVRVVPPPLEGAILSHLPRPSVARGGVGGIPPPCPASAAVPAMREPDFAFSLRQASARSMPPPPALPLRAQSPPSESTQLPCYYGVD